MKQKILITGAGGFVGSKLATFLAHENDLKFISRSPQPLGETLNFNDFVEGKFDKSFFDDVTAVVHLASIAHNFDVPTMEEMDRVSLQFTEKLLNALNLNSLKKFVYLSSIAVSLLEKGVILDTQQYGVSKKKTEDLLKNFHSKSNGSFQVTILRPPLVYGKNAPGNFLKLLNMLKKPVVLPFGSFENKRSFLALDNLISGIDTIIKSAQTNACKVYEISDPWVITLSSFMKDFKDVTKARAVIMPFPSALLKVLLSAVGKSAIYDKLALELVVDSKEFEKDFNWSPVYKTQITAFEKSL